MESDSEYYIKLLMICLTMLCVVILSVIFLLGKFNL